MKLFMNELKILCNTTLTRIEKLDLKILYVLENFYWQIDVFEAFKQGKKPKAAVGSLFDDWDFLEGVASGEFAMSYYHFQYFGGLLCGIGNEVVKLPAKTPPLNWVVDIATLRKISTYIFYCAKHDPESSFGFVEIPDQYWRIDLNRIYDLYTEPNESQISLHPLPNNLPELTKHMQSSNNLTMEDFEQVGALFKAIGTTSECLMYSGTEIEIKDIEALS